MYGKGISLVTAKGMAALSSTGGLKPLFVAALAVMAIGVAAVVMSVLISRRA